jgi:hypothetical protein
MAAEARERPGHRVDGRAVPGLTAPRTHAQQRGWSTNDRQAEKSRHFPFAFSPNFLARPATAVGDRFSFAAIYSQGLPCSISDRRRTSSSGVHRLTAFACIVICFSPSVPARPGVGTLRIASYRLPRPRPQHRRSIPKAFEQRYADPSLWQDDRGVF